MPGKASFCSRWRQLAVACLASAVLVSSAHAQWTPQQSGTRESLRGLSVVDERVVWASGSRGTYLRTVDAGMTWTADTVPGATRLDFRDIQAFHADTALLLSAGEGDGRIYRTTDGGRTWTLTYHNRAPQVFFDGMAFWDSMNGIAFSDPVEGRFLIICTSDGGVTWKQVPPTALPAALQGEAGYAASGTGVAVVGRSHVWIGTGGGERTRALYSNDKAMTWRVADVPMRAGSGGPGIYSVVFIDSLRGVAVGGSYTTPTDSSGTAAYTTDGGRSWTASSDLPRGYRSAVAIVPGTPGPTLIAAGPTGADYSVDGGKTWSELSDGNFNAVAFASAAAGWAVSGGGRIMRFSGTVPTVKREER